MHSLDKVACRTNQRNGQAALVETLGPLVDLKLSGKTYITTPLCLSHSGITFFTAIQVLSQNSAPTE